MNQLYHQLTLSRIESAVRSAQAVKDIEHTGIKGQLREIVIRDLFRPLLPADIGLGTGVIVTSTNQQSSQQDVVMFDRRILPPSLHEGTTGVFPVESVLYAIEIKSTLTASELKKAHENAKELESLQYRSGLYNESDVPQPHNFTKLIPCIFAFGSDLLGSGKSELDRYDEVRGSDDPAIKVFCVVGHGYWGWVNSNNRYKWGTFLQEQYPLAEVVGFIAGVLNTYRKVSASRLDPRLGYYLLQ